MAGRRRGAGGDGAQRGMGSPILTACSLDELLGSVLRLILLEVDNSKRRASRLNESAAKLVTEAARRSGHNGDLFVAKARRVSGGRGGCRGGARTLLDMEKSGRVLTTRALAAMLLRRAAASSLLNRAKTVTGRGARGARKRVREAAGRERARTEGAICGRRWWMLGEKEGGGVEFIVWGDGSECETLRPDSEPVKSRRTARK